MLLSLVNTPVSFQAFSSVKEAYKPNPQGSDVLSRSALPLLCQTAKHTLVIRIQMHMMFVNLHENERKELNFLPPSTPLPPQSVLIVCRTEWQFKVKV